MTASTFIQDVQGEDHLFSLDIKSGIPSRNLWFAGSQIPHVGSLLYPVLSNYQMNHLLRGMLSSRGKAWLTGKRGLSWLPSVWGWIVTPPPHLHTEALTPGGENVNVYGGRVFREVIKLKWGHMAGPSIHPNRVLVRRGQDTDLHKGKAMCGHRRGPSTSQRGRPSKKPSLSMPWSRTFQPLESWENKCLSFQPPSLGTFVTAAWADSPTSSLICSWLSLFGRTGL